MNEKGKETWDKEWEIFNDAIRNPSHEVEYLKGSITKDAILNLPQMRYKKENPPVTDAEKEFEKEVVNLIHYGDKNKETQK